MFASGSHVRRRPVRGVSVRGASVRRRAAWLGAAGALAVPLAAAQGVAVAPPAADGVALPVGWPLPPGADLGLGLLLLALLAWTLGLVAQRLGVPAALGELVGGLVGASVLPVVLPSMATITRDGTAPALGALAAIGLGAAMFTAGLDSGRRPPVARHLAASTAAFLGPLIAVLAVLTAAQGLPPFDALGLGGALVIACALAAGIVGVRSPATRVPHLSALSSLPLVAGVLAFGPPHLTGRIVGLVALGVAAWLVRVALVAMRARLRGLGRTTLFLVALVAAAAHAAFAVVCGLPSALGAGIAGFTMGRVLRGTPLADALTDLTRSAVTGAATPLLFAAVGLHAVLSPTTAVLGLALGLAAVVGRVVAMALAAPLDRGTPRAALATALALTPRGVVAAYLPLAALADGVVTPGLFAATVVAIALTLALDPFARRLAARLDGLSLIHI